jgi:hypothetical protein
VDAAAVVAGSLTRQASEGAVERAGALEAQGRLVRIVPVPDARDRFDQVHRFDPSHPRAYVEAELVGLLPEDAELTYAATTESRFPISIAYTEQSDVDAAEAASRAELDGGPITGLEPRDEEAGLTVTFWVSTIHATLPPN